MRFKIWRIWLKSKPWSLRWFVFLVLLRPVIDNFYFLKEISPFLSPLYWAGLLTPLLCIPAIIKNTYRNNIIHKLFNVWSALILVNTLLIILQPVDAFTLIQYVLKLSMPVYLFFFLRIFIKNKTDFTGLVTTFLYAAGIAGLILLYELLVNPIRLEYSRGIERIQGGYADIMNYAIYITFGFLLLSYFYITYSSFKTHIKIRLWFFLLISVLCVYGLIGISHAASYIVFAAILFLFLVSSARHFGHITFILAAVIISVTFLYGDRFYTQKIDPLASKEVEVIEGTRNESQLFHGRMERWQYGWKNFKDSPVTAWLFGYPTSLENPLFNVSGGIHNEYLRIFFFTGIVGFSCFVLFLISILRRSRFLKMPEKYLLYGSLVILLLYSVTTTPTLYANFLYILFTIFAYFSLPPLKLLTNE
jgi:O-Antigen ligase